MKRLAIVLSLIAATVGVAFLGFAFASSTADADGASVDRHSSVGVNAEFFSVDVDGIETSVFVHAEGFETHHPPERATTGSWLDVEISQFNPDTGAFSEAFGSAPLDASQFQIDDRHLTWATLSTVVAVGEPRPEPECFDLTLNLTWTGTGALRRDSDNSHVRSDEVIRNSHSLRSSRSAELSGSISGGAINLTDDDIEFAEVFGLRSVHVVIGPPNGKGGFRCP